MGFFNLATNSLKLVANPIVGFLLVALHQRAVAHDVGAKNCREFEGVAQTTASG